MRKIAHAERRYVNAHDLLLGSSLRYADEDRNDVVLPAQIMSDATSGGVVVGHKLLVDQLRDLRLKRQ